MAVDGLVTPGAMASAAMVLTLFSQNYLASAHAGFIMKQIMWWVTELTDSVKNITQEFAMGPTWGPPGSWRPQMGPMLAPWTLLSGWWYIKESANNLTHWGRVMHLCVSKLTIIGSDNGLSPDRRQAIIWTNDGILLIRTLGTNFSEILCKIHSFSFSKIHLKMSVC